jgi:hypothetical protein
MASSKMSRRDMLSAGAGLGLVSLSLLGSSRTAADGSSRTAADGAALPAEPGAGAAEGLSVPDIGLEDPQARFAAEVKMRGSLADEAVKRFTRLHIWGYGNEGNLVPFFSMNNYSVNVWRRLDNGNHAVQVFESGVYTKFGSYDVITEWDNPFTGERREIHQFRSGPLNVEFGPSGIIAGPETTVKPQPMQLELMGDSLVAMTQSSFRFPSPFQPDEFPKESPGPIYYWDSHSSQMSPLSAVMDPDVASAPSSASLTNFVSWAPWMGMAQRPGRTYGRGVGRKISGIEALPVEVIRSIEEQTPQMLDIENWGEPYDDIADYKRKLLERRG